MKPPLAEVASPPSRRLSPGRHGLTAEQVAENQRERLIAAMGEALAEHGYGRVTAAHVSSLAGVSSRTFYQHFDDLWDCLLVAYEAEAARLCETIESTWDSYDPGAARLRGAIEAALSFLAAEPVVARLLSGQPPPEAASLAAARRRLIEQLAVMLRGGAPDSSSALPSPRVDRRLLDGTFVIVSTRVMAGEAESLGELAPELAEILAGLQLQAVA